ncbi:NAD-dependent succinate-semialdehyde dehydrogenase [Corynebacterium pelargi]|uniref:Succinate-semialdehyde dehydrogenase [NADP(+)] 1 n=1 Tax=Corynebacterium pelargi TaxID=1471400 RepID=A0A410W7P0_9CORY|nr:NAD-dependent succinate-semialdehyde dehydrogenase [Corynebacterium pelargi]QAU51968.1 Succinate-semialdehyde dehydrogenase [NADP(+)] 1 [Corynebacterium pelargi]GGG71090.1 succinate-semialdehyde dehydrogenase [Corynebacterium pelargi]
MSLTYRVQNPVNNEVVEEFETATDQQIQDVLAASAEAFKSWAKTSYAERAEILNRAADLLRERRAELAKIAAEEMGKPTPAGEWEINFAADIIQFYADRAEEHNADTPIEGVEGGKAIMRRLPLGPLLGIMPWNYPFYQVARFAGPNLMNGNTVILKHAEICPKSSAAIADIFEEAGLPEGCFINVYASHDQISTIIEDPRIQGVSLTGSERAGSAVAAQAGKALKKCVLELGGTDAYIILDSDDIKQAAADAWEKRIENVGQACTSNKRIIVMSDIYDEFVDEMVRIAESYKRGNPLEPGENEYYPVSSRQAAENLDDQVKRAVAAGANLRTGGELDEKGAYFSPAVLTDVPVGSESFYEEFFGPIAEIYSVDSEEEAIALANDSHYGLGGAVFSTDEERAKRVASQVETGMIHVNLGQAFSAALPFGGIKNSGFGRELSTLALDEFVNKQTFYVND